MDEYEDEYELVSWTSSWSVLGDLEVDESLRGRASSAFTRLDTGASLDRLSPQAESKCPTKIPQSHDHSRKHFYQLHRGSRVSSENDCYMNAVICWINLDGLDVSRT